MWCLHCILSRFLSPRDITREGYNLQAYVADLILNGAWNWPQAWLIKAPNFGLIATLNLDASSQDIMRWCDFNGNMSEFSVKCAWEALRPRGHEDVEASTDLALLRCSLYRSQPDSHEHLFFECTFSSQVWYFVSRLAGLEHVPPILEDIMICFHLMAAKRTFKNVVGKLLFAASSYYIWLERNNRLFKNTRRSPEELRDLIMVTVRLKLVTFRFKNTSRVVMEDAFEF
ncbi:hypothetical protein Tco_1580443 [Tanacetum coccineum]